MVRASITVVDRGHIRTDVNRVIEGYRMGTADEPNPEPLVAEGPVYNLVIDHPDATVLWDTGSHPDAGDGHWPAETYAAFEHYDAGAHRLPDDLDAVGYALGDIDAVVMSHLHLDHAGGLHHFAGTDVPVYVHAEELKHAYYSAKTDRGDDGGYVVGDFDHDLAWTPLTRDRETHLTDVEFVHLPGHTPGLVGVLLHLDDPGTVIVAGDQAYARANYHAGRPLGAGLLWDAAAWRGSLALLRDLERRYDATVVCGHDDRDVERLRDLA